MKKLKEEYVAHPYCYQAVLSYTLISRMNSCKSMAGYLTISTPINPKFYERKFRGTFFT